MILDQFKLTGKTALVTGAKRGIGMAMAVALAEAGADILGVSASLESTGSEVEKAVTARGRKFKGYACDFGDRKALYAFITKVKAENSQIDILVNNAGTILRKPAVEHSDEYWDKVIEVNLNSQFILSREIGKEMVARGSGKIVFTASLLSFQGGITVPGVCGVEGGDRVADEGVGERVGVEGGERERDRKLGDMSRPTTRRRCGRMRIAMHQFWHGYRRIDGVNRPI